MFLKIQLSMIEGERALSKIKDVITIGDRRKRIEMEVERLCPTNFQGSKANFRSGVRSDERDG